MATLGQLTGAVLTPFVGAVSDYTDQRRLVGAASAWIVALVTLVQACVTQETWFFVALIQILQVAAYVVHQATVLSYLPGLYRTDDLGIHDDSDVRYRVNAGTGVVGFGSNIGGFAVFGALSVFAGLGIVNVAQIAQACVGVAITVIYAFVWHKLYSGSLIDVPALKRLPKTKNHHQGEHQGQQQQQKMTMVASFRRTQALWKAMLLVAAQDVVDSYRLLRCYFPDVGAFLLGYSLSTAGVSSFGTLAIVFLTQVLNFDTTRIIYTFFITLFIAMPAAVASARIMRRIGAKQTFLTTIYVYAGTSFFAYFVLRPVTSSLVFVFAIIWGVCFGTYFASNTSFYTQLVPKHAESHFMAMFYFAAVIFAWAPPALFTLLNQLTNANTVVFFITTAFFLASVPLIRSVDVIRAHNAIKAHDSEIAHMDLPPPPGGDERSGGIRVAPENTPVEDCSSSDSDSSLVARIGPPPPAQ